MSNPILTTRNDSRFSGVIPILATPFHEDESLDLESLERLVRFNIDVGVDGLTVLGLLGESNRLTDSERALIISTAIKAAGSVPVIVGTSHSGTAATIELSNAAVELGASAVMLTPPALPVPSDRTVLEYFHRIAARVSAPIVLQDHPAISQVHMSVDLILRLVNGIPSITTIKAESVPSPQRIAALKADLSRDRQVTVLTGLGALYGFFDLERGSDGFNTGFAFPEVLCAIVRSFRQNHAELARQIFARYLPLIVYEQQPGVAIRKEILRCRALLKSSRVRHPGGTIEPAVAEQLARTLQATFGGTDITEPVHICN